MDGLCFAKPFLMMDWLCVAKPINSNGIAAASQSQSIVKDWPCFAKPIRHLEFLGRPFLAGPFDFSRFLDQVGRVSSRRFKMGFFLIPGCFLPIQPKDVSSQSWPTRNSLLLLTKQDVIHDQPRNPLVSANLTVSARNFYCTSIFLQLFWTCLSAKAAFCFLSREILHYPLRVQWQCCSPKDDGHNTFF